MRAPIVANVRQQSRCETQSNDKMRKVTKDVSAAFIAGVKKSNGTTRTDGQSLFLHGNEIARKVNGRLEISLAGWVTATTCERVNGVLSAAQSVFRIGRKNFAPVCTNTQTGQTLPFPSDAFQAVTDAKL